MEKYRLIWREIRRFQDNYSVTRFAGTCRMLSWIARDELRRRARGYLKSDNTWEHGFYPVRGYYGRRFDDDGNEMDAGEESWWLRCLCEHHKRLYLGQDCSCKFVRTSWGLRRVLTWQQVEKPMIRNHEYKGYHRKQYVQYTIQYLRD